jgi:hypothetical protein
MEPRKRSTYSTGCTEEMSTRLGGCGEDVNVAYPAIGGGSRSRRHLRSAQTHGPAMAGGGATAVDRQACLGSIRTVASTRTGILR